MRRPGSRARRRVFGLTFDDRFVNGVMAAQFLPDLEAFLFLGELSFDGSVRHVNGILSMAHLAQEQGYQHGASSL